MLIDFSGLAELTFDEAKKLISARETPAVLLDEQLVTRDKNDAAAKHAPFIRRSAGIKKQLPREDYNAILSMKSGETRSIRTLNETLCRAAVLRGADCYLMLFNDISPELRICVSELYANLPGYDISLSDSEQSDGDSVVKRREERLIFERTKRHLIDVMGLMLGGEAPDALKSFNAADVVRSVAAAADSYMTSLGYTLSSTALPREIVTVGSARSLSAILAIVASNCARFTPDGRLEFGGSVRDGVADFRVSALTTLGGDRLERICANRIRRESLLNDRDGLVLDIYLIRLLASGSLWDVKADYSTTPEGDRRFTFSLSCPVTDGVAETEFAIRDGLPEFIRRVAEMEFGCMTKHNTR